MYAEFASDPKVQMMSEAYQRRLAMLFCTRCNVSKPLRDDEVMFLLRISDEEWQITKAEFIARNFIDKSNNVLNWDKRQYVSDSSTERVKRYREKKKQESNVSVTPPEQNRTEQKDKVISTKRKRISYTDEFEVFWKAYPTDPIMSKLKAFQSFIRLDDEDKKLALLGISALKAYIQSVPDYRCVHAAVYLNQRRFDGLAAKAMEIDKRLSRVPVFEGSDAWLAWKQSRGGRSLPIADILDKNGNKRRGWYVETEWPQNASVTA